jgi:hypothetical protein
MERRRGVPQEAVPVLGVIALGPFEHGGLAADNVCCSCVSNATGRAEGRID